MAITQAQYINKLDCIKKVFEEAIFFKQAVTDNLAKRSKRIFTDGKNSNGSSIGQYSTEPLYINPKNSPKKFTPEGKTGRKVFESGVKKGQAHKTKYFDTGYRAYKSQIGRQANFVNLNNFGNLKSNFENNSRGPIQVSKTEFIVGLDAENSLKKGGITEKYGEVFPSTKEEQTDFHKVVSQEFNLAIKNCG